MTIRENQLETALRANAELRQNALANDLETLVL